MNKDLIKKYKIEFDHWLNGGDLLFYDEHHGGGINYIQNINGTVH